MSPTRSDPTAHAELPRLLLAAAHRRLPVAQRTQPRELLRNAWWWLKRSIPPALTDSNTERVPVPYRYIQYCGRLEQIYVINVV